MGLVGDEQVKRDHRSIVNGIGYGAAMRFRHFFDEVEAEAGTIALGAGATRALLEDILAEQIGPACLARHSE